MILLRIRQLFNVSISFPDVESPSVHLASPLNNRTIDHDPRRGWYDVRWDNHRVWDLGQRTDSRGKLRGKIMESHVAIRDFLRLEPIFLRTRITSWRLTSRLVQNPRENFLVSLDQF